jgi:arylsulfatase A-like enzyme
LGSEEKESLPEDHGFDLNVGGGASGSPYNGRYFSPFNNPRMEDQPEEAGMSLPEKLAKETNAFIEQNKDTTFFAFLSFYAVHGPIQSSQPYWKKYRDKADSMGIADTGFDMSYFLPIRRVQDNPVYAGLVQHMDDAVGSVMETLKANGLDENTIVIFTSDHGGVASGDNYSTSNLPLRGGKGIQFEGGLKVPFFVSVPWMNQGGEENTTPVINTDFYPTILDLAGADLRPDEHNDGVSLAPLLEGNEIAERPLFWHYPHYGNQGGRPSSIVQDDHWKLIRYHADSSEVLFDLNAEAVERTDVSKENPEVAGRLSTMLTDYLGETGAKFPTLDPMYDQEEEAAYLKRIKNNVLPRLEKQRMEYLSPDYDPGNNWWGSEAK